MSDAVLFTVVFAGFVVMRLVVATLFFYWVLPESDRCPCCDEPTVRVQARGWNLLMPWFRTSWCYACGWEGLLRHGEPSIVHRAVPRRSAPRARRGA